MSGELMDHQEELLSKSVKHLHPINVRMKSLFVAHEIKTIGELVAKSEEEILRTPNFGKKSLRELKELLARYGLHFRTRHS